MADNLPARTDPKPALVTGGNVAAIIPKSIEEIFRLAGAISASGMAPSTLNTAEKVTVAILAGAELGMPPFQSLQSFAVINGRPTIWGDGLIAVVRSNGFRVREWLEGEGDDMIARCEVTRPDSGEVVQGEFSVADAKKANLWGKAGPWQTNPKRMLKMRARGFACRDGAADVLRGFQLREEVEDYQNVRDVTERAAPVGLAARLAAAAPADEGFNATQVPAGQAPPHDAETGEIVDAEVEDTVDDFPGDRAPSQAAHEAPPAVEGVASGSQVLNTLSSRVDAFRAHCTKAPTSKALAGIWALSQTATLLKDIDGGDADEVGTTVEDLTKWFDDLKAAKVEAEREAAKGGE